MVDRFKQGPFGKYLEIPQPIKVHGMLTHNLLKKQIILPNSENEDEIWFGLGQKEAWFRREECCLCSGLNMGILPEGFREKEEVLGESILTRHFTDESPTIELLEVIFNWLTEPVSGDDALKMRYLLMVSQFFGIDEARTAIPAGKHLGRLRGDGQKKEKNEEKNKNKKEENKKRKKKEEKEEKEEEKKKKKQKKKKKKKTEVKDGEDGEEETDYGNQQNNDVVKYFIFHSYGFLLAFQVWAIERITHLEGTLMANPRVFFDLSIDGHPAGRIVMELFANSTQITAENFLALCTGEKGIDRHGDITHGNGTGGESIYGPSFTYENFMKKHIGPGIMSMAKIGTRGNWSLFFICTAKTKWLDHKQVFFSQLVKGFEVLKTVNKIGSSSGFTSKPVMVIDCSQLC
ncbi:hypothetical protein Dsin_021851 [Dipteronia sinensis]|uniref:PPIase cyclophilin-type domain-containing protein n=1 Tax=Dipteronia sinensis TaxID=43782 RepID=A0AAE0A1Q6_9ROSI|nr:hypothetical protein Dsin_021851 [Dipteronia sinensis]